MIFKCHANSGVSSAVYKQCKIEISKMQKNVFRFCYELQCCLFTCSIQSTGNIRFGTSRKVAIDPNGCSSMFS